MQIPLELSFRNMDHSDAVETAVREKADKLEQFHSNITSCRVIVEALHRHHHKGNTYHVRVDLTLPGHELVASRDPGQNHAHEDVYAAIRDAFNAARRQLEALNHKQQRQVKHHEAPPHGRVHILDRDHGRIQTSDGRDIYFHRNSLVNGEFDRLQPGDEVRFDEEMGDEGPQASSVRTIGKHHIVE
ncbi:HPF/RaiA family ribosome-associated protein [Thiohalobacter thiocyanaticus]|uniref:HPF/RaiA family ribosome-associated protein n=1 Tax=Thiohalobacter thiocyanaticus TaxID=585455 RepID=A0A426QLS5_9GAMM|nr:HPF/RaiA family ribosome-associated protein [Thiohalobacter thiocyanaticus]RRQ22705.1 HPF/RaiA family ribosome-associated protein [Thiohalobacter thiocyanaticus]